MRDFISFEDALFCDGFNMSELAYLGNNNIVVIVGKIPNIPT